MLTELQSRKEIILIGPQQSDKSTKFSGVENEIFWSPNQGLHTTNGKDLSPTTMLNHEVDHALDALKNPDKHEENGKQGSDSQYDSKEEKRVITGSEQETAKKLGEIKDGEVTRTDHRGDWITTADPTSNKEVKQDKSKKDKP
jgi:hypothetical protein